MSFDKAAEKAVEEISNNYNNFYLALSGGYDSEFILRVFYKHNIEIIPIIVRLGNEVESKYAYNACRELGITPIEIYIDEDQFIEYYTNKILKKLNGIGYHATHALFAAEYVKKKKGVLLTGGHLIGSDNTPIKDDYASSYEYDFYIDYIYPTLKKIDLYLYSIEIMYSMLPKTDDGNWSFYKHKLLELEYREKMKPVYSESLVKRLRSIIGKREDYKHVINLSWTREEFHKIFDNYVIEKYRNVLSPNNLYHKSFTD